MQQSTRKDPGQRDQEIEIACPQAGNRGPRTNTTDPPAQSKDNPTQNAAAVQLKRTLLEVSTQYGFVKKAGQQLINNQIDAYSAQQDDQQTQIAETQEFKH